MGCNQSKIENEEAISRCKERKLFMKEAVSARNAFAAAHSSYSISLKNTGAALNDFAQAEIPPHLSSSSSEPILIQHSSPSSTSAAPLPPISDVLPPPPPDHMDFQPLQRAVSMPEMKIQKPELKPLEEPIIEEDETESEAHDNERLVRKRSISSSNRATSVQENHHQQQHHHQDATWDYFFPSVDSIPGPSLAEPTEMEEDVRVTKEQVQRKVFQERMEPPPMVVEGKAVEVPVPAPAPEKKAARKVEGGRRGVKGMNLMKIFEDLDDHFLKASESAQEVSKMLEATRLHYHSNFADNRGHIDHSARVMRVITWNRSFRGVPNLDDGKDDFDREEHETHATVLDKMLAWEKKLYDEVKAGELMKYEYQRKVNSLNKQKKRGTNTESIEKLKAAVSHLHTRYIVDMQSMDSTVSEINRLRDEQLYPKLVQLVDGMATMWKTMLVHHEDQSKIVNALRFLDISQSSKETSEHHHDRTFQLLVVVQEWQSQFCKLIDNQKAYIKALNSWLKLNLIPIESNLKEKVSSPPRVRNPPIQPLLIAWHDFLDKLPDEVARTAINNFAAVIHTILQHQEEEMKLKEKCEETRKELSQKTRKYEDWWRKYMQQRTPEELDPERAEDNSHNDAIAERQSVVDAVKIRLKEEEEAYRKQCLQVREKSMANLKTRLPELFRAMSEVAHACSEMYKNLRSISQAHRGNAN
ncbi:protein ROLLING AND ERECT LEAF 2 [Populus alba x Populus x berolinensis]|nr:protein ROLLING AND ERECT LEAF 2 [Populus alba x Populus x berolinensis]